MLIFLTETAEKDLAKMPGKSRTRVERAIEKLLAEPFSMDLRKLKGQEGLWRLRVGPWRIIMEIDTAGSSIYALHVIDRKDAYR